MSRNDSIDAMLAYGAVADHDLRAMIRTKTLMLRRFGLVGLPAGVPLPRGRVWMQPTANRIRYTPDTTLTRTHAENSSASSATACRTQRPVDIGSSSNCKYIAVVGLSGGALPPPARFSLCWSD